MSQMRVRRWSRLTYHDSRKILAELGKISNKVAASSLPYRVASLRTNALKTSREGRQCALFCFGMSTRLGTDVAFAFAEEDDLDFVARYTLADVTHYVPLQMKEFAPDFVAPSASIQQEVDKLAKYADSSDLVVAFHINRDVRLEPASLDLSQVKVAELWFVGYLGHGENWLLLGNLLSPTSHPSVFEYPDA
ncbi:MAG TPA: hypothetical protein VFH59_11020 [Frateuria sp.]|uniref:hypothetical protein n=1 Tax=Frateuria sp. TaxID=2211372 RepID=UPI002D7EE83B|nr:hypothetical protein [Frateuria sp.]HET6805959.1 hypothetical protein [Frateuria sp.]